MYREKEFPSRTIEENYNEINAATILARIGLVAGRAKDNHLT